MVAELDKPEDAERELDDLRRVHGKTKYKAAVKKWRKRESRNGDVLLVPAGLFGIALLGRIVSVAADGTEPGFWLPMAVEAITVVVLLVASRVLPHPAT